MEIRRPLKRGSSRLGLPDIYPQDPKQKEDELTSVNVKQGYICAPLVSNSASLDEFGTAKNANIDAFGVYFSALLSEKHRINTLKDTQKKKQLVNTKEIWYVHAKTKNAVDNWFRDLANGTKSLGQLGKRIPIFNSKEGMFLLLYESQVPLSRAVWFIKMSAVHAIALSESNAKTKKRQIPDHCQELTQSLCRYLKELLTKIIEFHSQSQHHNHQQQQLALQQQSNPIVNSQPQNINSQSILQQRNNSKQPTMLSSSTSSSSQATSKTSSSLLQQQQNSSFTNSTLYNSIINQNVSSTNLHASVTNLITSHSTSSLPVASMNSLPLAYEDYQPTLNQWQYQTQLARYLFDEGLLDQHDFLCWLLDLIEKKKTINEIFVRTICPLVLEYVIDFTRSAVLSRRLAHVCARRLSYALNHYPISAKSQKRSDQQYDQQPHLGFMESFESGTTLIAKQLSPLSNSNKFQNHFDSKISDSQSLLRNSNSLTGNHITANSIIDIVRAQIIENQTNIVDGVSEQENSESNLYKNAMYILSSILQVVCIECPTAMVRHSIVDAKPSSMYQGSPLDHLPCLPSKLPMTESDLNFELRKSIYDAEREILHRSAMADARWSCDNTCREGNSKRNLVNRLLNVMDALDKHNFDKVESNNSMDSLYTKIFPDSELNSQNRLNSAQGTQATSDSSGLTSSSLGLDQSSLINPLHSTDGMNKKNKHQHSSSQHRPNQPINNSQETSSLHGNMSYDEHVVKLLCDWATTTQRTGEHRALVVARFLEKRQAELQNLMRDASRSNSNNSTSKSKKSGNLKAGLDNLNDSSKLNCEETNEKLKDDEVIQFLFQNVLVQFLDENGPIIQENRNDNLENKKAFNNLVLLFGELIRCDVFSHYNYMCSLISRGMFSDLSIKMNASSVNQSNMDSPAHKPASVKASNSDSLLANTLPGLSGNLSLYPLTVSTNQSSGSHLGVLSNGKLISADQSLRSLGFSPVSSQNTTHSHDKSGHNLLDNHIDDVDADLGKILQDIKEGQQDDLDILLPDYLGGGGGGSRDENKSRDAPKLSTFNLNDPRPPTVDKSRSDNHNFQSTADSKSNDAASSKNPFERRHMLYVKHFFVPDDENFSYDSNQRSILMYGFGKEREDARHTIKKFTKEICKIFGRRASRDINAGGLVKRPAIKEGFNPEATIAKFEALPHYDKHVVTNSLSISIMEMFTSVANGQASLLPCIESISFAFDLFAIASNVSGLIDLIIQILEELTDIEAQIKLKCPPLSHHYCQSIALCSIGMLSRYNSCVLLLSKEELTSIFESLQRLICHVINPGICATSAERVIFAYLYELYTSQNGKFYEQFSSIAQKVKQTIYSSLPASLSQVEYEWSPTFLMELVNQACSSSLFNNANTSGSNTTASSNNSWSAFTFSPMNTNETRKLYVNDSSIVRQIQESPRYRYGVICDAIHLSAISQSLDLVNEIAVLCADLTAKCPALFADWIIVLRALCCSQSNTEYRMLLSKINITDPQTLDNIATFTAVLVARRCINLNEFIMKCALTSVLTLQSLPHLDRNAAEPCIRLTCYILLSLFRSRGTFSSASLHNKQQQANAFGSHSAFSPSSSTFSYASMGLMGTSMPFVPFNDSGRQQHLYLKYLSDHHLLRSACSGIKIECLITLLKAMRLLVISANPNQDSTDTMIGGKSKSDLEDITMTDIGGKDLDRLQGSPKSLNFDVLNGSFRLSDLQNLSLHQFADMILRLICSQRWLHDKCLLDSETICTPEIDKNILIDPDLEIKQSQRLLFMICYNRSPEKQSDVGLDDLGSDQVTSIVKMFENLDCWTMRLSLMRLKFMFAYCKSQNSTTLNDWLDNLAKAVVEFYQKASQEHETMSETAFGKENVNNVKQKGGEVGKLNKHYNNSSTNLSSSCNDSFSSASVTFSSITKLNKVWLVEPLLERLAKPTNAIQGKIVKATASLMESASIRANYLPSLNQTYHSTAAASTKFKERTLSQRGSASTNPSNLASTSLLGFQPFLSLILACLKSQDKEKETLLLSLNSQLYQAIHEKVDDIAYKQSIQDGLELRLCLIGQMFDTIQKSASLTSDWATLMLLIIMNHLVDPQIDYRLYATVLDMLAILIHSAYASDPIDQREEAKKQYQNLMKKFRKELAALEEKEKFISMNLINPLMPLVRQMTEVVTCEPMGSLVDTKGEKLENFYSIEKKKGLKVAEIQDVNPWDLIEGHKNPAPLSWPWFGAIRIEQKALRADENNRLMSWHTHNVRESTTYFCQNPKIDEKDATKNKRSTSEKKPSDTNPLLKSLIEASDDCSSIKKESAASLQDTFDVGIKIEPIQFNGDSLSENEFSVYFDKAELMEEYCDMPVDMLFDSAPIETMIEDIKSAMHAEYLEASAAASAAARVKTPTVGDPLSAQSQKASSILAPVQQLVHPSPPVQPVPLVQLPPTPVQLPPTPVQLPPTQIRLPTPPVQLQPVQPLPQPQPTPPTTKAKAPRKKRRPPAIQQQQSQQQPQLSSQQQQQAASVYDFQPYQQQPQLVSAPSPTQAKMGGPIQVGQVGAIWQAPNTGAGSMYGQGQAQSQQMVALQQHPHPQQQHIQQPQAQVQPQIQAQHQLHQHTHQHQHHHQVPHQQGIAQPQLQFSLQQQQQHRIQMQQQQQQQQQHHHIQYQHQQVVNAGQHPQQHPPQLHRIPGHQQVQQQQMQFQQQQQMFVPQQAAGHSRPALTAMLHQKHATANLENKIHKQGFNY